MQKKMTVYIMVHKEFDDPRLPGYTPLWVGSACHKQLQLPFLSDDTGDHISEKNIFYSELTGVYWAWKNDRKNDVLGICHYRRFFQSVSGAILSLDNMRQIMEEYDVILPTPEVFSDETVYDQYIKVHDQVDLIETRKAMELLSPEYLDSYDKVMSGNQTYCFNMLIATKEIFFQYASWLFPILFEVEKHLDISNYNDYQRRVFGFISERLLTVFFHHHSYRVYEAPLVITDEKKETKYYIDQIEKNIGKDCWLDAFENVKEAVEIRPDVFQLDSDIFFHLNHLLSILQLHFTEQDDQIQNQKWNKTDVAVLLELDQCFMGLVEKALTQSISIDELLATDMRPWEVAHYLNMHDGNEMEKMQLLVALAEKYSANGETGIAGEYANYAIDYGQRLSQ